MASFELICPAGTLAALRAAVDAGADSVYVGFRDETNARNFPGLNFSRTELRQGVDYAHARGKQVFVAINTYPTAGKAGPWHRAVDDAADNGADAVILADLGLLDYAARSRPRLRLHLSVQASAANPEAIGLYRDAFGVRRVVLPRVLTIADITKERVRRVIKKLSAVEAEKQDAAASQLKLGGTAPVRELDLGFKVFKLGSSNFKVWDAATAPKDSAALAEQLKLMAHNVEDGRPDDALLYELVLKSNLPLTSKINAGKIGEQPFYDVADGALVICLARKLTQTTLRGMMARKPKGVVCLDIAFAGNDQLKANIVLEMKSHGIEFHTA